jgi:integrase
MLTVGEWLHRWLDSRVERGELKASTAHDYRDSISRFLAPWLGAYRLGELRATHVTAAYDAMRRQRTEAIEEALAAGRKPPRPLGPLTMRRIHAALSGALASAVRQGLIPTNVAANAERVKATLPRIQIWEPAQLGQFLDAIGGERLAPVFHLAAFAGLRRGELAGLRWSDVDLDGGRLVVASSCVRVGRTVVVGTPKTASGEGRVVDLDAETVKVLRRWRAQQAAERLAWGPAWLDTGLTFTREDGRGWQPDHVSKGFARLVRRTGLPPLKLHGLRHVAVSLQLAAGVDPIVIAMRTGHSSTSLIRSTYGHLIGGVGQRAAEAAAALVPRKRIG